MFKQLDYTMVTVSDMDRSIEFYRDRLGLNLKMQSPEWTEFETGQTTLALHGGGTQQERTQPAMEGCKMAGTCSIGFNVENVEQTYRDLQARGVEFIMPPTAREGEGIKLTACLDPDGLPISFAQLLR